MHSYTSSFRFILSSVFVCAAALVAWSLFISLHPIETLPSTRTASADRLQKTQNYFLRDHVQVAFVGTSLTAAILPPYVPQGAVNLGFQGDSVLTALEVVARKRRLPERIIVEMNILHRPVTQEFVATIEGSRPFIWRTFPASAELNRPSRYLSAWIRKSTMLSLIEAGLRQPKDSSLFRKPRERIRQGWSKPRDEAAMRRNAQEIRKRIAELEARGADVFLTVLPVHPEMRETTYFRSVQRVLSDVFPRDRFQWIGVDSDDLVWRDGIHLNAPSALRVASRLVRAVGIEPQTGSILSLVR